MIFHPDNMEFVSGQTNLTEIDPKNVHKIKRMVYYKVAHDEEDLILMEVA